MKMDALVAALAIIATAVMANVGAVDGAKALLLIGVLALRSLAPSCPVQRIEGSLPGGQGYRTGPSAPSPPCGRRIYPCELPGAVPASVEPGGNARRSVDDSFPL